MRLLHFVAGLGLGVSTVAAMGAERRAPQPAVPVSSPGTWITTEDYPIAAMRHAMTGITRFRLSIDPAGKPNDCQVTESSGFDVLDRTTCQYLMARAEFTPALDAKGKVVAGTYANRVRWELPPNPPLPLEEFSARSLLRIDQAGKIVSCSLIAKIGGDTPFAQFSQCPTDMPTEITLLLREHNSTPVANVEMEMSLALTAEMRDKHLKDRDGYTTMGVSAYRFQVNALGLRDECIMERQRGDEKLIYNFCRTSEWSKFVPSRDGSGELVVETGWFVMRMLRKRND